MFGAPLSFVLLLLLAAAAGAGVPAANANGKTKAKRRLMGEKAKAKAKKMMTMHGRSKSSSKPSSTCAEGTEILFADNPGIAQDLNSLFCPDSSPGVKVCSDPEAENGIPRTACGDAAAVGAAAPGQWYGGGGHPEPYQIDCSNGVRYVQVYPGFCYANEPYCSAGDMEKLFPRRVEEQVGALSAHFGDGVECELREEVEDGGGGGGVDCESAIAVAQGKYETGTLRAAADAYYTAVAKNLFGCPNEPGGMCDLGQVGTLADEYRAACLLAVEGAAGVVGPMTPYSPGPIEFACNGGFRIVHEDPVKCVAGPSYCSEVDSDEIFHREYQFLVDRYVEVSGDDCVQVVLPRPGPPSAPPTGGGGKEGSAKGSTKGMGPGMRKRKKYRP